MDSLGDHYRSETFNDDAHVMLSSTSSVSSSSSSSEVNHIPSSSALVQHLHTNDHKYVQLRSSTQQRFVEDHHEHVLHQQHQKRKFSDAIIQDDVSMVDDMNCDSASSPVLEVARHLKRMRFRCSLTVRLLNGRHITLEIDSTTSVDDIKRHLEQLEGIPVEQQRLVFDGRQLCCGSVEACGIHDDSTIYLLLALPHQKGFSGISSEHRKDRVWTNNGSTAASNCSNMAHRRNSSSSSSGNSDAGSNHNDNKNNNGNGGGSGGAMKATIWNNVSSSSTSTSKDTNNST
jgi:hypothetical protein